MRAKGLWTSGVLLVVLLITPLTASAEVQLTGPLPEGLWTDLLHLGSDFDQRINNGQIGNDYLNPESEQMPYPGMEVYDIPGATENPMVWTPLHEDDGRWSTNFDNYVKYWHVYVISPTERQVRFQFGHDDDFYVWNNGTLIIKHEGYHGGQLEAEEATLAAGMNSITMKLKEGGGGDYMEIKVTDLDGNPMPDLTYSLVPMLTISEFTIADYDTGNTEYTNDTYVSVSISALAGVDAEITGYMITETDTPPALTDNWSAIPPDSYSFIAGPGSITLYAWAKDSEDNIASAEYTIMYQMESIVPKAQDVVAEIFPPGYPEATITADQVDAGSVDLSGTGITGIDLVCADDLTPDQPHVTLDAAGDYPVTMIVQNGNNEIAMADATITIKLATETTDASLFWEGGAGSGRMEWYWGLNWDYGTGPQLDTPGTLTFGIPGSATDGTVTNKLANDRAVANLVYLNPPGQQTINHTTDLNSHTLTIKNQLYVGSGSADNNGMVNVTFQNGALQIGTPEAPASLLMGTRYGDWQGTPFTMTVAPDTVFVPYFADLELGRGKPKVATFLDLRDIFLPGGVLQAQNLMVRSSVPKESSLRVNDGTGLSLVDVEGTFSIGDGLGGDWWTGFGRFGDPDNDWLLPANVSFTVGDPATETRGNVIIGQSYWGGHGWGFGWLAASSGGTFDAYVTDFIVAKRNAAYPQSTEAMVDLAAMDSCTIDATNFYLGVTEGSTGGFAKGTIKLPAGTLKADSAFIGDTAPNADSYGTLDLNGTVFSITTALQMDHQGTVRANVAGGASCGLDIADTATVAFNEGSLLEVNFIEPNTETGTHWGLRWAGDHITDLETLQADGKLVIDDSALGETAGIFSDGTYTYIGVAGTAPPALDGDANGDCKVNIIDLIYIRNRLNQDPASGDNASADANSDGKINIIDLIYVRNRLNTRCE